MNLEANLTASRSPGHSYTFAALGLLNNNAGSLIMVTLRNKLTQLEMPSCPQELFILRQQYEERYGNSNISL